LTGRPSNAGFLPSLSVLSVGQNSQGRLMPKDLPDLNGCGDEPTIPPLNKTCGGKTGMLREGDNNGSG